MKTIKQFGLRFGSYLQMVVFLGALVFMGIAIAPPSYAEIPSPDYVSPPLPLGIVSSIAQRPRIPSPPPPLPPVQPPDVPYTPPPLPPGLVPPAPQPPPPTSVRGDTPGIRLSGPNDINTKILCPIFNLMFWVLLTISIIMVLWAGYQYATAGDDTEKTSSARKTITYAAVGVAVALIAKGFPALVGSLFDVTSGIGACY